MSQPKQVNHDDLRNTLVIDSTGKIKSTREIQEFYNTKRREAERTYLEPCSANKPSTTKVANQRGRRDGKLDPETNAHANFKKELKIVCQQHKDTKRKCTCYDLSELEENYQEWLKTQNELTSDLVSHASGGEVPPLPRGPDTLDLPDGQPPRVRPHIEGLADFNIYSGTKTLNAMVSTLSDQEKSDTLTIGRARHLVPICMLTHWGNTRCRWQCEYPSTNSCTRTGSLEMIFDHWRDAHQAPLLKPKKIMSKCVRCKTETDRDVEGLACPKCHARSWEVWCYAILANPPGDDALSSTISDTTWSPYGVGLSVSESSYAGSHSAYTPSIGYLLPMDQACRGQPVTEDGRIAHGEETSTFSSYIGISRSRH